MKESVISRTQSRGNEERPQAVIVAEPSEETEDYVESLIFEFNKIGVQ